MSYSSTNPVERVYSGLSNGKGILLYRSTHTHSDIEATGFFADGKRHGMKIGDALLHIHASSESSAATWHVVSASTGAVAASDTAGSSAYGQAFNVA
jgi:hypothetical protein